MKENINEHDKTKEMMNIIRNGFKSKLITEAEEMAQPTQPEAPNNVPLEPGDDLPEVENQPTTDEGEFEDVTPQDFKTELDTLKQQVSPMSEITELKINRTSVNVIMKGIILRGDVIPNADPNSGMKYSGIYFTFDMRKGYEEPKLINLNGSEESSKIISVLPQYYINFKNKWAELIPTEYPPIDTAKN